MSRASRRWLRVVGWGVAVLVVAVAAVLGWWLVTLPDADGDAVAAVRAAADVEVVDRGGGVELHPATGPSDTAVIFYPGAGVPPEAYLPTWVDVVRDTQVSVHIPAMPLRLAVLAPGRADRVRAEHPDVSRWWIGGHSLGGAMASSYAGGTAPGDLEGLILWAAFATGGAGLEQRTDLTVVSVSGSEDGLATPDDIAARRELLPDDAVMVELDGVNHAQFGRYGAQRGDGTPRVSDARAAELIADAAAAALDHTR